MQLSNVRGEVFVFPRKFHGDDVLLRWIFFKYKKPMMDEMHQHLVKLPKFQLAKLKLEVPTGKMSRTYSWVGTSGSLGP